MFLFILLTKTTAAQNEGALIYHSVRGLYFQSVVFVASLVLKLQHLLVEKIALNTPFSPFI